MTNNYSGRSTKLLEEDIARHSNWKNFIDETTLSLAKELHLHRLSTIMTMNLGKSAMNIIDMVKSGDLAWASKEMQKYTNAGGTFVKVLQIEEQKRHSFLIEYRTKSTMTKAIYW